MTPARPIFRHLLPGLAALALLAACSKSASPNASPAVAGNEPLPANATPEQRVIAQARAAVGPDAKLNAIDAIYMSGQMLDGKNNATGNVTLVFKKPGSQLADVHYSNLTTVVQGSDGIIGWAVLTDKNNNRRITMLKAPDEMQNTYMAMENLYFYRAADQVKGAKIAYEGDADYRGTPCHKVSFAYPDSVTYVRFFDSATGQLRGTVLLPTGMEVVPSGTLNVQGILFPAVLTNYDKSGNITQVVKFDKIVLNPRMDPKLFNIPDLLAMNRPPATRPAAATAAASGAALPNSTNGFPPPEALMPKH